MSGDAGHMAHSAAALPQAGGAAPQKYSLTQRQAETLAFIRGYIASHGGLAPSYREIASGLGLNSTSRVSDLIASLVERGRVSMLPHRPRSLVLTGEVSP